MDDIDRYLAILELTPAATEEDVRRAYRDLVMVWHPDRFAHNPGLKDKAAQRMAQLSEAHTALREHFRARPPSATAPPRADGNAKPSAKPDDPAHETPPERPRNCAFCNRSFGVGETIYQREMYPACRACKMREYRTVAAGSHGTPHTSSAVSNQPHDRNPRTRAELSLIVWLAFMGLVCTICPPMAMHQRVSADTASQNWPTTTGTVGSSGKQWTSNKGYTYYTFPVDYQYMGQMYQCSVRFSKPPASGPLLVYVDPTNPKQCLSQEQLDGFRSQPLWLLLFLPVGVVMLACAFLIWRRTRGPLGVIAQCGGERVGVKG